MDSSAELSPIESLADMTNIASCLERWKAIVPRQTAITVGTQSLDFAALDELSDRYAAILQATGIQRGTRTALMVTPGVDFIACAFALFKLGALPVMVDPGLGFKEVGACLKRAKTQAFVGVPKAHLARVLGRWGRGDRWLNVWVGKPGFNGHMPCLHPEVVSTPLQWDASINPDQAAAILFTSGSTGSPKGVMYTHRMFLEQLRLLAKDFKTGPGYVSLPTFPLFALFDVALGMTIIIPKMNFSKPAKVDAQHIVELIGRHGVTHLFGSPALIQRVGEWAIKRQYRLLSLRVVLSAGAPVAPPILKTFASLLSSDVMLVTPYGATEALPVALIDQTRILDDTLEQWASGGGVCVGHLVDGIEAALIPITDAPITRFDAKMALPQGAVGEIVVRGAQVSQVYDNLPEATLAAKMSDERGDPCWHRMGDVGRFDEQGRLWFLGRKAHRVEVNGEQLLPIPCEAIFNQHPAIKRSALVSARGKAVICVEREAGFGDLPWRELVLALRALAQRQPHTRAITTFLEHPAFPVDIRHNAKIRREILAQWASQRV